MLLFNLNVRLGKCECWKSNNCISYKLRYGGLIKFDITSKGERFPSHKKEKPEFYFVS